MRRTLLVAGIAAVLTLTGCAAQPVDPFIDAARQAPDTSNLTDEQLRATGDGVCNMAEILAGTPAMGIRDGVIGALTAGGLDEGYAAGMADAALEHLCPQYLAD